MNQGVLSFFFAFSSYELSKAVPCLRRSYLFQSIYILLWCCTCQPVHSFTTGSSIMAFCSVLSFLNT
ncbi:hypothetical protein APHAL10511_002267 [Amanita phalloides]|nr:hypothetical protein APHAL10511_002267 [Amanita phalloides]